MPVADSWRPRVELWVARWWAGEGGAPGTLLNTILWPAEQAYRAGVSARNIAYDSRVLRGQTLPIPVISVGNLGVGGAGKTPIAAWVAQTLASWGHRPGVILRGYGEDEVWVHRELNPDLPVFTATRRADAAGPAIRAGCDVLVLDDGFQHRSLARDLDLLLISAESWAPRRPLLPRGPWRESLSSARRADVVLVTRKSASPQRAAEVRDELLLLVQCDTAQVHLAPFELHPLHGGLPFGLTTIDGEEILAVAGLASPGPFAHHLRMAGAAVELIAFPDHHEFTSEEAEALRLRAAGRRMVVTLKDAVKLRRHWHSGVPVSVLRQKLKIEHGGELLEQVLRRAANGYSA